MAGSESDSVFVGRKPIMNYVLARITLFQSGSNEICLKAIGRAIIGAVDIAEIVRCRFVTNAKVTDIKLETK